MFRQSLLLLVIAVANFGCSSLKDAEPSSQQVAKIFSDTCLQTAIEGDKITKAFSSTSDFAPSGRSRPGPRTAVYDGPKVVGVTQRFPTGSAPSRSCAIYASVADIELIHKAAATQIMLVFPNTDLAWETGQASEWSVTIENDRAMRIISSRLGPNGGMLNPLPGNVRLIVYLDDVR